MKFTFKLRDVSDGAVFEHEMEFPDMGEAVAWMEKEDQNPDRQYDIVSIRLTPKSN